MKNIKLYEDFDRNYWERKETEFIEEYINYFLDEVNGISIKDISGYHSKENNFHSMRIHFEKTDVNIENFIESYKYYIDDMFDGMGFKINYIKFYTFNKGTWLTHNIEDFEFFSKELNGDINYLYIDYRLK